MDYPQKQTESFELDETQPLAAGASSESPTLPPPDATPDQVRHFLAQVLTQRCHIDQSAAESVASSWTLGSGRELREYPVAFYKDMFGAETAWVLCREVREQQKVEQLALARPALRKLFALVGIPIIFLVLGITVLVGAPLLEGLKWTAVYTAGLIILWLCAELMVPSSFGTYATLTELRKEFHPGLVHEGGREVLDSSRREK